MSSDALDLNALIAQLDRDARVGKCNFGDVAVVLGRELVRKTRLLIDAQDITYRPAGAGTPLLNGAPCFQHFVGEELRQARALAFTNALLRGLEPHSDIVLRMAFPEGR